MCELFAVLSNGRCRWPAVDARLDMEAVQPLKFVMAWARLFTT